MMDNIENEDGGKYIPGVCNIGKQELNRRRNGFYLSVILLVVNLVILLRFPDDHARRLTLFFTGTYMAISFQQWYFKFCVKFGVLGVSNFGELGKTFTVEQKEYLKKDKAKALKMILLGVVFGAVFTTAFYFI